MLTHRKRLTYFLFLTHLLFTADAIAKARTDTVAKGNSKIPGMIEGKARAFMANLTNGGFEVSRGYFKLWDKEDCDYAYAHIGMCGNNPAAPYVIATVPPGRMNLWTPLLLILGVSLKMDSMTFIVSIRTKPS